jgi:cytidylate kinase
VITISREGGSGGSRIADLVARRFDYTLLDRDVIDRICASSGTRRHIVEALDEHVRSQVANWCEAMVAQHYTDSSDYVRFLLETICSIAALGGVVVVGRGSNIIVGPERGLHVRVVAPRDERVQRVVDEARLDRREADREVTARDRDRAEFIRKVFGRKIADPAGYDLVINTGGLSLDEAVDVIAEAARRKFQRLHEAARRAAAS